MIVQVPSTHRGKVLQFDTDDIDFASSSDPYPDGVDPTGSPAASSVIIQLRVGASALLIDEE